MMSLPLKLVGQSNLLEHCSLAKRRYFRIIEALSSSWLGHGPLKAGARVRVPLGLVNN